MKPKRRGRPPIDPDKPVARVHLTLAAVAYDRLYRTAQDQAISVPEVIRRHLDPPGHFQPK
jgi:hypothetical protein